MKTDIYYPARYVQGARNYVEFSYELEGGQMKRQRVYFDRVRDKKARDKQARAYVKRINGQLAEGWRPNDVATMGAEVRLLDGIKNILALKKTYARHRTLMAYSSFYDQLARMLGVTCGAGVTCGQFGKAEAVAVMDALVKYRQPNATTYNNYLTAYRGWLNELVQRGLMAENSFKAVRAMKEQRTESRTLTDAELGRLVEYLRGCDRWYLLACELLYYCGIRRAELVGLKVAAIDLERGTIHVPGGVAKNGKARTVAMPSELVAELRPMLEGCAASWWLFGKGLQPCGVATHANRITDKWQKVREALGWPVSLKWYGLKDTAAEKLLRAGVDVGRIRDLYDHSSVAVTDAYLKRTTGRVDQNLAAIFPKMAENAPEN